MICDMMMILILRPTSTRLASHHFVTTEANNHYNVKRKHFIYIHKTKQTKQTNRNTRSFILSLPIISSHLIFSDHYFSSSLYILFQSISFSPSSVLLLILPWSTHPKPVNIESHNTLAEVSRLTRSFTLTGIPSV